MKKILLFIFLHFLFSCSYFQQEKKTNLVIDAEIFRTQDLSYHLEGNSFGMKVPRAPIMEFYQTLLKKNPEAKYLKDDFFIPVLTDDEFKLLAGKVGTSKLEALAKNEYLQNSRFSIVCLASTPESDQGAREFFLIADSSDLIRFRLDLEKAFISAGGPRNKFFPAKYQPYISLAGSGPDMATGIKRSKKMCIEPMTAGEPFDDLRID